MGRYVNMDWIPLFIWTCTGLAVLLPVFVIVIPVPVESPSHDNPLALPVGLGGTEALLMFWDLLDPDVPGQKGVEAEEVSVSSEPDSGPDLCPEPARVRLHGIIRAGDEPVYCFLDTVADRWFRMRPGQLDEVSGLILDKDSSGELTLVHLETGQGYDLDGKPLTPNKSGSMERNNESDN